MQMSENGKKLLAQWEGIEEKAYKDSVGKLTIGVGHLILPDELSSGKITIQGQAVSYANGLTNEQVFDLLAQDLVRFEEGVNNLVTVSLTQNQFDALVSFSFNLGVSSLKESTLLKRINAKDFDDVPNQFMRWVKAGGKTVQGLVNRRANEVKLWKGEI